MRRAAVLLPARSSDAGSSTAAQTSEVMLHERSYVIQINNK